MGNFLLEETATKVKDILGDKINDLSIERAVFGLFSPALNLAMARVDCALLPLKKCHKQFAVPQVLVLCHFQAD